MCNVKMDLVTPAGVPVTIEFEPGPESKQALFDAMQLAADATAYYVEKCGWRPANDAEPEARFAGYLASPAVNAAGFPSFIILEDGRRAMRHSKQDDTWYSVKNEDGTYEQILRFGPGDRPATAPPASHALPTPPALQPPPQPPAGYHYQTQYAHGPDGY